jgi:starch synthase
VRVSIVTREWPPDIYGGAGVHVEHLVAELRKLNPVEVHCFGGPKPGATNHPPLPSLEAANPAIQTLGVNLAMIGALGAADIVHSHTWYANLAGHLASLMYGIPHVVTAHSLEPLRPWKAEQLGGGYRLSSWVEQTAYASAAAVIAVSHGMRRDILQCYPEVDPSRVHVVHNGIDTTAITRTEDFDALERHGIDPMRPYVLFVGRITRQKGLMHLLRAVAALPADVAVVLCAASPDTPELGAEVSAQIAQLSSTRTGVHWLQEQLPRAELVQLLSHAAVFACPSIYEPLGIVNLEAMASYLPVVASDVGGIPEVVVDGQTGLLVHYDPRDPDRFETDFAAALTQVLANPTLRDRMGHAGRDRAVAEFGWDRIARATLDIYQKAVNAFPPQGT